MSLISIAGSTQSVSRRPTHLGNAGLMRFQPTIVPRRSASVTATRHEQQEEWKLGLGPRLVEVADELIADMATPMDSTTQTRSVSRRDGPSRSGRATDVGVWVTAAVAIARIPVGTAGNLPADCDRV